MKKTRLLTALIACISFPAYAADECVIHEKKNPGIFSAGQPLPIDGPLVTTQELDIGVQSATTNSETTYVSVWCSQVFWVAIGADASATAGGTDSEKYPANLVIWLPVVGGTDKIDTAADS